MRFTAGAGANVLNGGANNNTASYTSASAVTFAHLDDSLQNTGDSWGDTYVLIQILVSSNFNDTLVGTNTAANDHWNSAYAGNARSAA